MPKAPPDFYITEKNGKCYYYCHYCGANGELGDVNIKDAIKYGREYHNHSGIREDEKGKEKK